MKARGARTLSNGRVAPPRISDSFVAGALSGAVASIATHPFDVVKTHMQVELGRDVCPSQVHATSRSISPQ